MSLSSGLLNHNITEKTTSNQHLQSINSSSILSSNHSVVPIFDKISAQNSYSIKDIKNYTLFFNSTHKFNEVLLNSSQNGNIAYFMISNSSLNDNIDISFRDSRNVNHSIEYFPTSKNSNYTAGKVSFSFTQNWYLTFNFSTKILGNDTYYSNLTLYFPQSGYNFQNAINVLTNQTNLNYQALFPYESIFIKMYVQNNRRVDFVINQLQKQIINKTSIRFYQGETASSIPSVISDTVSENSEPFTYSWVSEKGFNEFFIEIKLNQGLTGNLSLLFNFQQLGYSLDTAIPLSINKTSTYDQQNRDRYDQSIFFRFQVNQTDVNINLFIKELDPLVIANSKFRIYHENKFLFQYDVAYSAISNSQGIENKSFTSDGIGTYYIEFVPSVLPQTGSFTIQVTIIKLPVFIWSFEFIIIDILYFIVLPALFLYIFFKNNKETIEEWELNKTPNEIFKTMSKNPRFNPKLEVPFQKILLLRKNLFVRDIILDIVPVQLESDEKYQNSQLQTSLGLRFKKIIDIKFSIILVVWLLLFWIINTSLFFVEKTSLFPYRISDLKGINNYLYFLTFPIALIILIIYFYNEIYIKNLSNEIEYSIKESLSDQSTQVNKNLGIDNENILKNLAYVRVLWNQSVKAFNEKNYSLFVIRADNAIKKLIETRFVQLIGNIDEKLDFNDIIELIRNQGFDVPSTKKIEYFRKIRNKVVHSSHIMDEKTAIETFNYYSKFLGRLGMRT